MPPSQTFRSIFSPLPLTAALFGMACTIIAAHVIAVRENERIASTIDSEARHISGQLKAGLLQNGDAMRRVAGWWLLQGRPYTSEDWQNDGQLFMTVMVGLDTLNWIDPNGNRSWSARPGSLPTTYAHQPADSLMKRVISESRKNDSIVWSEVFHVDGTAMVYGCTSIKKEGRLVGFVVGRYHAAKMISSVLKGQLPEQYDVAVTIGDESFPLRVHAPAVTQQHNAVRSPLLLPNATWWVEVAASRAATQEFDPSIIAFGTLGSLLLYAYAAMARVSRRRAIAVSEANVRLVHENGERRAAEEKVAELNRELQRKLEEFKTLLEVLPIGIAIANDPECRNIWTNRTLAKMLDAGVGNTPWQRPADFPLPSHKLLRDGNELPTECLPMQVAARTKSVVSNVPLDLMRPDGTVLRTLSYAAPLFDENGNVRGVIDACVDITEQLSLKERLQRAEKYKSLALMAGGVAHDFNNLLTVIMGHSSTLTTEFPEWTRAGRSLAEIERAAKRAASLVAQLLAFTGRFWRETQPVDLSAVIEGMKPEMEALVNARADLRYDLATDLPAIEAGIAELAQTIQNLVMNAGESFGPDGHGQIEIRTSCCGLSRTDMEVFYPDQPLSPGTYVRLEVTDNGCGIPENVLPHVFDPFFTTKFLGRGLGLSAVHGIVRAYRGGVRLESSPESGTRVEVILPVGTAESAVLAGEPAALH